MIFYNGFNLLLDIVLVYFAYRLGKTWGYRQGEADNAPPFWSKRLYNPYKQRDVGRCAPDRYQSVIKKIGVSLAKCLWYALNWY
jgi:hypothetical protein